MVLVKIFLIDAYQREEDAEQIRKLVLVNTITLFAIIVLFIVGGASFARGNTMVGGLDLAAAILLIFCIGYLRRSGRYRPPVYVGMTVMTVLFTYLFFTGGAHGTGFMWYYTYPLFTLYVMGRKVGTLANTILFVPAFVFLLATWNAPAPLYSQDFTIRFIPSVVCVFLFSYLFEATRERTHRRLTRNQDKLSDTITALREKEAQLETAYDGLEARIQERTRSLQALNKDLSQEILERKRLEGEREQLQGQLIQAQKMEAIGALAGRVAHDLNNILSGLVSYPELLLYRLPDDSDLRKPLSTILHSGRKAATIVQDLLTMARRNVKINDPVDLDAVVQSFGDSPEFHQLRQDHPDVTIDWVLAPTLLPLNGSPVHLEKSLMNLVGNAVEAISGKGNVTIRTESRHIDAQLNAYEPIPAGQYAVLTVTDTGSGIAPTEIRDIFEPFFTSKVMGRSGTGLGLAVVWGTVKDHNGYIDVRSEPGEGTAFSLYFPITEDATPSSEIQRADTLPIGQNAAILLVDDDPSQRRIAGDILTTLEYRVDTVDSGEAAIAYLQRKSVDLVILDMIMDPGMDGLDTYKHILADHPTQRVIMASGYSETDRMQAAGQLGILSFIQKPYSMETIATAVANALADASTRKN